MEAPEAEIHPKVRSYKYLNCITFKFEKYKNQFMFLPWHHNFVLMAPWARNHPKNKDEEH